MDKPQDEKIMINDRILQYGVLSKDANYQVYLYPGMTVAEIAFDVMVTIRILEESGCIKNKTEFIKLINKYYDDPQYAPLKAEEIENEDI